MKSKISLCLKVLRVWNDTRESNSCQKTNSKNNAQKSSEILQCDTIPETRKPPRVLETGLIFLMQNVIYGVFAAVCCASISTADYFQRRESVGRLRSGAVMFAALCTLLSVPSGDCRRDISSSWEPRGAQRGCLSRVDEKKHSSRAEITHDSPHRWHCLFRIFSSRRAETETVPARVTTGCVRVSSIVNINLGASFGLE